MGQLLDRATVADLLNNPLINNITQYSDAYISGLIAEITDDITHYLHYNPVLTLHTAESGTISICESGPYAGRYYIELQHKPLISDVASDSIISLQLTYALAFTNDFEVDLSYAKVFPRTGQVFCLAAGSVEALAGLAFNFAPVPYNTYAVGYSCTYVAGYLTGINDITRPGNVPYAAQPLPGSVVDAAVLLFRERLMFDDALTANPTNPSAASLLSVKAMDREERYAQFKDEEPCTIGMGSPLARAAQRKLKKLQKKRLPIII